MAQTAPGTNRKATLARNALGISLIVLILAGLFSIGKVSFDLLSRLNYGFLRAATSWITTDVFGHLDGWITAVATGLLFWATWLLRRSTEVQVAGDAPLVRYRLFREEPNTVPPPFPYFDPWQANDRSIPQLVAMAGGPPKYIRLEVQNEQAKPYGVALDVTIKALLLWGATDDQVAHPFSLPRTITIPALGAGKSSDGRIFDVGALPNYVVRIDEISYDDVRAKKHSTSYGVGILYQKHGNVPLVQIERAFKPAKGEIPK